MMKKGLIALGCVVILIIGYLFWYYTSSADDEIYLMQKDFTGIVIIRYDVPNGADIIYENGKRIYNIPSSGILETKFSPNEGWSDPPQYYYLDGANRIPITRHKVYSFEVGTAMNNITNKNITYASYIVSDEKSIDSLYNVREKMNILNAK
nr:hypothetical protein [uncultured Flavobacterium sp.]